MDAARKLRVVRLTNFGCGRARGARPAAGIGSRALDAETFAKGEVHDPEDQNRSENDTHYSCRAGLHHDPYSSHIHLGNVTGAAWFRWRVLRNGLEGRGRHCL